MENYYIINMETQKLELHFDKATYAALDDSQKASIKSNFLWGRSSGCWISRAKYPNTHNAERVARSLGLENAGKTGERLSFAQQMERKQERAEARAERYEARAEHAAERGAALQKPINDMHGDIAFFTQPNINSSAGRAFTRRRDTMFAAFDRGMDEFRKSEYWQERAQQARQTASGHGLNDPAFLMRRIEECKRDLRGQKRTVERCETILEQLAKGESVSVYGRSMTQEQAVRWMEETLDRMESTLDKLGFYQERLDELGGVRYSSEDIKPGYIVRIQRYGACRVLSTGPKNFTYQTGMDGIALTAAYAEIETIIKAEEDQPQNHPFAVGDTFTCSRWNTETRKADKLEYRIIRATDKSVTIQTDDEKPFVRKPSKVQWAQENKWRLCITDWNDGTVYKIAD